MGVPALRNDGLFCYRDYATWPNDERWELVDGVPMAMAAPSAEHQRILARLFRLYAEYFDGKPCEVLFAPFDVLMPEGDEADDDVETVVQPDLMVFCDPETVKDRYARGVPTLVVEVLSPSTSKWDQNEKYRRYERAGVGEYWIVDPAGRWACVYARMVGQRFDKGILKEASLPDHLVASARFPGLVVDLARVFS